MPIDTLDDNLGHVPPERTARRGWLRPPPDEVQLEPWLRDAVRQPHDGAAPPFDAVWRQAQARTRKPTAGRWRLAGGALAAAAALLLFLMPHSARDAAHPAPTLADATLPAAPATPQPSAPPAQVAALLESHLIYARTDSLLPSQPMLYASQPAYYVSYDPITLEIIP